MFAQYTIEQQKGIREKVVLWCSFSLFVLLLIIFTLPKESVKTVQTEDIRIPILASYASSVNVNLSVDDAHEIASNIVKYADYQHIKPTLLAALITIESGYKQFAISDSNAIGLMQVLPKYHKDKIQNNKLIPFKIEDNIALGSMILREYLDKSHSVREALLRYNGSLGTNSDYAKKILSEQEHIKGLM